MSETIKGFVVKVPERREGKKKDGTPWFKHSFKMSDDDGNEIEEWFQMGFNKPIPFKEGDYITVDAKLGDWGYEVAGGKIINSEAPEKPKTAMGGGGSSKSKHSEIWGEIGGYNTEDDISRMVYRCAREDAIRAVEILGKLDSLPVSEAKGPTGAKKRYEQTLAIIDKLTKRFIADAVTGRVLEHVADEGEVKVKPDIQVPDQNEQPEPEPADDGPPPPADEGSF